MCSFAFFSHSGHYYTSPVESRPGLYCGVQMHDNDLPDGSIGELASCPRQVKIDVKAGEAKGDAEVGIVN